MSEVGPNKSNPNWNRLQSLVKSLSDELFELAEVYFNDGTANNVRDWRKLLDATLNISHACLEVMDSTCMVMAIMRSIVKDQSANVKNDIMSTQNKNTRTKADTTGSNISEIEILNKVTNEEKPRVRDRFNPILSLVEVAMSEMKNIVDANGKVVTDDCCPRKAPNMIDNVTQNEYEDNSVGTKRKTKQNFL